MVPKHQPKDDHQEIQEMRSLAGIGPFFLGGSKGQNSPAHLMQLGPAVPQGGQDLKQLWRKKITGKKTPSKPGLNDGALTLFTHREHGNCTYLHICIYIYTYISTHICIYIYIIYNIYLLGFSGSWIYDSYSKLMPINLVNWWTVGLRG